MERKDYNLERKEKSQQLIKDFSDLVNGSADSEAILSQFKKEHRTLQQSMFNEILKIICMVAKMDDKREIDGRNQYSKEVAVKLIEGYAEMIKKQEMKTLIHDCGYTEEQAEKKAEQYRISVIENPGIYLGLPTI